MCVHTETVSMLKVGRQTCKTVLPTINKSRDRHDHYYVTWSGMSESESTYAVYLLASQQ